MNLLAVFFVLIFGAIVGSFLNVVIMRLGARGTGGRSACLSCTQMLRWYELIPLLSFVAQRGRCRSCATRISYQYPLVEILTGFVFVLVFSKYSYLGFPFYALRFTLYADLILWALLIVIAVYDLRHKIIPDDIVYVAIFLSFLHFLYRYYELHTASPLDFWGAVLLPLPFATLWLVTGGRAMGLGDAKLLVLFSLFLGFAHGLSALVVGFWLGASLALVLLSLRLKRFTMKTELPLAPFLILGLFVVYLTGIDVTGLTLLLS